MNNDPGTLVFVDGRDALAAVIVSPAADGDGVAVQAQANGISKPQAAAILREVADRWDPDRTVTVDWEDV